MSGDEQREIRGAMLLSSAIVVGIAVCCAVGGCGRDDVSREAWTDVEYRVTELEAAAKQPTPAPVDYSPRFDSIDKQLAKLAEHSVVVPPVVPPKPVKCQEKKKP